jgi:transcription termination factor Rho
MQNNDLQRVTVLRRVLHPMNTIDAMEFMLSRVGKTKTNTEFLDSMNG